MDTPSKALLTAPRRVEDWRFDLLDQAGNLVGELDGVTGGSLDFSIHNTIRSGGSLDYDGEPLDWNTHLIRVWYILRDHAGVEYGWPWGTFHPATNGGDHTDTGVTATLTLYDNLLVLDQDGLDTFYTIPAGTPVMQAMEQVVTGGLVHSPGFVMDDTAEVVRTDRVWEPVEENTRLRIANDLAESINYGALDTTGYGVFESRPLGAASSRGIAWEFVDDENSVYAPDFKHERDTAAIPNKVVGFVDGDDETDGFLAVATDEDPKSPWSYQSRGRWITRTIEPTEATSQQVLQGQADRALRDGQQVASSFEIVHDIVPIRLNDAIRFANSAAKIDVRGVAQSFNISIDFKGGSEMTTRLREVIS
ncbi:MAG TPA: hypothetical protein VK054_13365 [Beutenbergiaceae bacterium]|nr:hypothetical protein [Beutenbergiaceae bacterium]